MRIYVRLGEHEQAFAWLGKAVQERNRLAWEFKVNPLFEALVTSLALKSQDK